MGHSLTQISLHSQDVTLCCCIREGRDSPHLNSANVDIYAWTFLLLLLPMGRIRYFCQPVSDTYLARQWSSPWRCTSHSPGWKSKLQFWIWISVLSGTHGMRWAGLSKLCLGSSVVTLLPACHMNPSKILSPEGLGSHSCPLPDNYGIASCRRTESTTHFATAHENVPRYRYIQIRDREMVVFLIIFLPIPSEYANIWLLVLTAGAAHSNTFPTTVMPYICLFSGEKIHPGPFLPTSKWWIPSPQPHFFTRHLTFLLLVNPILKISINHTHLLAITVPCFCPPALPRLLLAFFIILAKFGDSICFWTRSEDSYMEFPSVLSDLWGSLP